VRPVENLRYRGGKVHVHMGKGETACLKGWGPIFGTTFPRYYRGLAARLADRAWTLTNSPVSCLACLDAGGRS
jgi:hypothetical protein